MEATKVATAIKSFPGMPGTAVRLLALIDNPAMRVSQIEQILRHDPGLILASHPKSARFGRRSYCWG